MRVKVLEHTYIMRWSEILNYTQKEKNINKIKIQRRWGKNNVWHFRLSHNNFMFIIYTKRKQSTFVSIFFYVHEYMARFEIKVLFTRYIILFVYKKKTVKSIMTNSG